MYHQKDRLRRDMMNNGKIYESVEKMLRESIVPSAEVSKRYNATYGASDFNVGMLHAAMLDTSVGGCSFAMREITAQSIGNPRYSRHSPSDEWFRNILSKTDEGKALETFNQAVRAQLDEICLLGRLPDVLDVAIDMHLIPCHSKKLGSDLRGGERKSGTNRFETYITAQCVNSKSRLILAALYMDKSSSVHEFLRRIINLCLENASAVGSRLGLILVDRGFFSVNSISEIEHLSLEYLMPCTRTSRVKDSLRKFVAKTLGPISKSDMTNSDKVTVQYHMIITKKKRVGKESEKAGNGGRKVKKADAPEDRYIAFATNAPWMDVGEYSKRWTIETCYRLVENARAKSFGSDRPARLFCFLYSLTLFNAWVLVNAQLASFLKLRGGVLPVTQLYMKIATLIAIYQNITIQPEPPPDPVAP